MTGLFVMLLGLVKEMLVHEALAAEGLGKLLHLSDAEIAALTRRAERAEAELAKMKRVVEIQGNLSALLEQMLGTESASGSTER